MRKSRPAAEAENPTVRFAKLQLKGETYSLAFDFNGLALAEEMSGVNLMQALRSLNDLSITQTRALLYASLRKRHSELTLREVGAMMDFHTLPAVTEAITAALENALPESIANPPEPAPDPANH